MSKLQLCWIKDECTTYSCVWRISRNLRLQTPVDGYEGKSSTGDKGAHERADEDCFETELKIILISNVCRIYGDDNRNDNKTKDQTLSPKYPRRGANAKAAMGVIPPWIWNSRFWIQDLKFRIWINFKILCRPICWHELFMLILVRKWQHSLFRCVNLPQSPVSWSVDHATWYIFCKLWPTAFRPKCILPKCIFATCFFRGVPGLCNTSKALLAYCVFTQPNSTQPTQVAQLISIATRLFLSDYFHMLERIHVPDIFNSSHSCCSIFGQAHVVWTDKRNFCLLLNSHCPVHL